MPELWTKDKKTGREGPAMWMRALGKALVFFKKPNGDYDMHGVPANRCEKAAVKLSR